MIVLNLTVKVHVSILEGFLAWLQQEHIPSILSTGSFSDYKFYRLLEQDESEGPTFVLQFYTQTHEEYRKHIAEHDAKFQKDAQSRWGEAFVVFQTAMEELC